MVSAGFTTLTFSPSSVASDSTTGAIIRQGPHQAAQKSTRTGFCERRTSASKSESVTAGTASDIRWAGYR